MNIDTIAPTKQDEDLLHYKRDGFIVKRKFFSDEEVEKMRQESEKLLGRTDLIDVNNLRTAPKKTAEGELIVERFDPLVDISAPFKAIAESPKLIAMVGRLLEDAPLLFKDKLIYKLPGTQGYNIHQDWNQWEPFPAEDLISVMVAIDGADESNGALALYPGYTHLKIGIKNHKKLLTEQVDPEDKRIVETQPGDAIFFSSLAPHESGANTSNRMRRQFYPSYSAARHGSLYMAHYDFVHARRRFRAGEEASRYYLR